VTAPGQAGKRGLFRPWLRRRTMRHVPSVMQIEAVECGAASLAMILAYHGRYVTLEELRIVCGVSRDGTKASNIVRAARRYGLIARGYRREPEGLDDLPWPMILHWNFNHFVVLEGLRAGRATLNDPAMGRRVVDAKELSDAFTGIALVFEPGPDFQRGGRPQPVYAFLWSRLRRSRRGVVFVLLASFALVIPGVALPAFSRVFVDGILVDNQLDWALPFLSLMGGVILLRAATIWAQQRALVGLETKLATLPQIQFLNHLMRLPIAFFGQRDPGELVNRLTANERIARLLSGELADNALALLNLVFFGVVMFFYGPVLAGGVVLLNFLNLGVLYWSVRGQRQAARLQMAAQGKLMAATVGPIRAIETIKASSLEPETYLRWTGFQAQLLAERRKLAVRDLGAQTLSTLIQSLTTVFVLGLGALRVMDSPLTLGGLLAFQGLAASFGEPILKLVGLSSAIQGIRADVERVQDVLRAEPEPSPSIATDAPPILTGRLELRDITFGYSPLDPPLIEDFSLLLRPGMRIALLGGSGSGKSTVGRIAAGLVPPWRGQVLLDDRPAETLPMAVRAQGLAYVDQDVFLFEGSIRENLSLWDPTVPEADLSRALADAAILDDVAARPQQIDAAVTEGGTNLSGGQRQRLEIARALVGNPSLLILDEATAALDVTTEKVIDDNLRRRGCTCLIIAHRLSTIRDCDEIIVMHQGKIVERGTHEALMAAQGPYAALLPSA
jgi:NHLM bacteriocin system ABC transporter peptidase/ATP-binding protein